VRKQAPGNKKSVFIHLTPKGRNLKTKLVPLALDVNRIASRGAPAADVATLRKTLLKMIENLAEDEISALRPPTRQRRARLL
jgi:MarR family transcriptional regulator, organic hydroperoxide resistance regulator